MEMVHTEQVRALDIGSIWSRGSSLSPVKLCAPSCLELALRVALRRRNENMPEPATKMHSMMW